MEKDWESASKEIGGGDAPPARANEVGAKALADKSYSQTYIILKESASSISTFNPEAKASEGNEVFFRCGNWCYRGLVQFNGSLKLATCDLPVLIPTLQKQQGMLRYYCNSSAVPPASEFYAPLGFLNEAAEFFAGTMMSPDTEEEMAKLSAGFPWIDDSSSVTYFELALDNVPRFMDNVAIVASKTYTRGLIIISIYCDETIYFVIHEGEGDQALLDVRFPNVSKKGQGMHLASFTELDKCYRKLTLWHLVEGGMTREEEEEEERKKMKPLPSIRTLSVSSKNYQQTYVILKSAWEGASPALSVHHDVLFRFGSWCYAGRVQLIPALTLADIPFVIPALRMQQNRLQFLCEAGNIPTTSPFAGALDYLQRHEPYIEQQIEASGETLSALIERLSRMGLGDSVSKWLEGDPANSFFEFKLLPDAAMSAAFKAVEVVASKSYHASGIITTTLMFQNTLYVCLQDGSAENPLLDSRFPDISGKGRGYQIQAYEKGLEQWPTLRKVSVWQTVSALEQEFKDRAALLAQDKTISPTSSSSSASAVTVSVASGLGYMPLEDGGWKSSATTSNGNSSSGGGGGGSKEVEVTGSTSDDLYAPVVAEEKDDAHGSSSSASKLSSSSSSAPVTTTTTVGASSSSSSSSSLSKGEYEEDQERELVVMDEEEQEERKATNTREREREREIVVATASTAPTSATAAAVTSSIVPDGVEDKADSKEAKLDGSSLSFASFGGGGGGRLLAAKPHHLPKMGGMNDSLKSKLSAIRQSMGEEGEGDAAPWDVRGKPLGALGGGSSSSKK